MIAFGKQLSLRVEDVYGLPDDMHAKHVLPRFKQLWDEEIQRRGPKVRNQSSNVLNYIIPQSFIDVCGQASLLRTFFRSYLRELLWSEVIVTIFIAFSLLGPSLIVYELLLYSVQANTDWLRGLFVILALDSRLWCASDVW